MQTGKVTGCLLLLATIFTLAEVLAACADTASPPASATHTAAEWTHLPAVNESPSPEGVHILVQWTHLSSADGELAAPGRGRQTSCLILDVDNDGVNDFVIGGQEGSPSMEWWRRSETGWTKYPLDDDPLRIEAGGAFHDIDGDGDLDVVEGEDHLGNKVYWWENPYPDYDLTTPWSRRVIKDAGESKHHDQIFGDFDGDGEAELVFWNQGAERLFIAEIPLDPKNTQPWPYTEIYSGTGEGLAMADIDGDGQIDLLAGGRWFEHHGGTSYLPHIIDDSQTKARIAAGDLRVGGNPEVVMVPGDGTGSLRWYESVGDPTVQGSWVGHGVLGLDVDHGHSLQVADFDGDGSLDIFCGEMRLRDGNPDAKTWVFLGDGGGEFKKVEVATGIGIHEGKVGDLDGDGDIDILGKPFTWDAPRLDIWLNPASGGTRLSLDYWQRHVIDAEKPWRSVFVASADMDGDRKKDIVTGGWWYRNPGSPGGTWTRNSIGLPLRNMAGVYDFDGDGDNDVLGTRGRGSQSDPNFVWARNDGSGQFTILDNIESGDGDFLQGVAVERFQEGESVEIALSWHSSGKGVQMLAIPANASLDIWHWRRVAPISQDEGLSAGDIDGDGDIDLLLGTKWLRNDVVSWSLHNLHPVTDNPDRNRLADVSGDGRLDAIVGFEAVSAPGKLAWYEQGDSATSMWIEHEIATVIGPMSLDVCDMDYDGDVDVVVGEHNMLDPSRAALLIFENDNGEGTSWTEHVIYTGDEHHDGAQVVDIDGDGDLDIVSIGWSHDQVLLYENLALDGSGVTPTP